jgi:hypothetical protein
MFPSQKGPAWLAHVSSGLADQSIGTLLRHWGLSYRAHRKHKLDDGSVAYVGSLELRFDPKGRAIATRIEAA